jgi:hypothetical protein
MCTCTRCRDADGTCSATTLRRAEMSGSALGRRAAGAGGARRLPAAVRAGAGAPGSGRVHHQGALRRAGRQAKPGGPSQARAETLGPYHRRGRRPAGGGGGPGQPPQRRAAGATLDTITVVGVLPARPVLHLDTGYDYQTAGRCWPSGAWLVRSPTRGLPSPHPGRPSLAGGAYPCVGQPVRKLGLVHRTSPAGGGVLAGAGQRRHRLRPADPPRLELLPLGQPTPPPITAYSRRL